MKHRLRQQRKFQKCQLQRWMWWHSLIKLCKLIRSWCMRNSGNYICGWAIMDLPGYHHIWQVLKMAVRKSSDDEIKLSNWGVHAREILATTVDAPFSMGNRGSPARCHHVSMGALPPRFVVTPEMEPSLYWLQQSHHWQPSLPRSQVVIHDQYSWSIIVGHLPVTWPKLLISGQGFNSFTIDNHLSL